LLCICMSVTKNSVGKIQNIEKVKSKIRIRVVTTGLKIQGGYKLSEDFVTPGHQTWQCVISSCEVSSGTMFTTHHFQRHYQNCENASTPQSGTSHKTSFGGFDGSGSVVWTSAVSHVGRTSNVFKVAMKLQTFLFQMVVTSCISVQYSWKYDFAKSSENLYAPCTVYIFCAFVDLDNKLYKIHGMYIKVNIKLGFSP
jgi:hypothetical protein